MGENDMKKKTNLKRKNMYDENETWTKTKNNWKHENHMDWNKIKKTINNEKHEKQATINIKSRKTQQQKHITRKAHIQMQQTQMK